MEGGLVLVRIDIVIGSIWFMIFILLKIYLFKLYLNRNLSLRRMIIFVLYL